MDIVFGNKKLAKIIDSEKALVKKYGQENARVIMRRMIVLKEACTLADVPHLPPDRRHQLTGDRKGEFAVDLKDPYRLVFTPNHPDLPRTQNGGIDLERVTAITILGVEDYH